VVLKQQEPVLGGKGTHGYFPEQGIGSVVVTVENGDTVEVGIIGVDTVLFGPCGSITRFWASCLHSEAGIAK